MVPETMVRVLRLNLLVRIAIGPNLLLKAIIFAARHAPKSWIAEVERDFVWLKNLCAETRSAVLDECATLSDWIRHICAFPKMWKKHIKVLCSSPQANLANEEAQVPEALNICDIFECDTCRYVCTSSQQLRLHAFKAHGIVRTARKYLGCLNACPACFRRYPTRTQALRHMSGSTKCASYPDLCEEIPPDEVIALDAAETEVLRIKVAGGSVDCCALRSLPTLQGPLMLAYEACYKGRPRVPLVEMPDHNCPAEHFGLCTDQCLLCGGSNHSDVS